VTGTTGTAYLYRQSSPPARSPSSQPKSLGPWLLHLRSRNASKTWQTTPSQRLKRRDHKPHRRRTSFCSLRGRGEAHAHACANLNACMTARVTSAPPCSSANATLAGGGAGVRGRQRRKFDTARTQTNCRETMKGRRQELQHMSNMLALPSTMHLHDSSPRSSYFCASPQRVLGFFCCARELSCASLLTPLFISCTRTMSTASQPGGCIPRAN
jgi:hypothetical protein